MIIIRLTIIFDPRQLPCLTHDIEECGRNMSALANPSVELVEEWLIYTQFRQDSLPNLVQLPSFWGSMGGRFPDAIWMPMTSVDVERSFSQYKHSLNERRESWTGDNTQCLMMLHYNGDIEKRFN